ncbi:MAG: hypothetical protein AVDCRST_MAG66-4334, partial [uncultured Pseudonocardia sp.]
CARPPAWPRSSTRCRSPRTPGCWRSGAAPGRPPAPWPPAWTPGTSWRSTGRRRPSRRRARPAPP